MEKKEEQKQQQTTPRTYTISSEQLMDIMRYLMTRPYGEVVTIMNTISTLTPFDPKGGEKDNGKK